jgi:hypothetical protein
MRINDTREMGMNTTEQEGGGRKGRTKYILNLPN